MDIKDYRLQIDRIDRELIALLEERVDVAEMIGAYKRENGLPVLDAQREKEKLEAIGEATQKPKSKYVQGIFEEIMAQSRNYQSAAGPKFGVLGRKLPHTFSPELHAEFGNSEYGVIEKEPEELAAYLTGGSFKGINVTIPYKKEVIKYCDELSSTAEATQSVNTIYVNDKGKLVGDNTDYYGFTYMLKKAGIEVAGKKTLVLGSGGVSGTIVAALEDMGASVVVISRSGKNNYDNIRNHSDAEVIVNATPVGMFPNAGKSLIRIKDFPKLEGVADVIYNPLRTKLVLDAERAGLKAIGGLPMLVAQGAKANELFGGRSISEREIDIITERIATNNGNIVLIGMPGAGKTTIGRRLAERLDKEFVDSDEYIEQQVGKSAAQTIEEDGIDMFRYCEAYAIRKLMTRKGCVIALGGGAVENPSNYVPIRENGYVIHVRRPLEELPTEGRPVSQSEGVESIYERRLPLYEAWSDVEIWNRGSGGK